MQALTDVTRSTASNKHKIKKYKTYFQWQLISASHSETSFMTQRNHQNSKTFYQEIFRVTLSSKYKCKKNEVLETHKINMTFLTGQRAGCYYPGHITFCRCTLITNKI